MNLLIVPILPHESKMRGKFLQLTLGIDPFSSCLSTLPADLACRLIARASSLERWSFSSKRAVLCALPRRRLRPHLLHNQSKFSPNLEPSL